MAIPEIRVVSDDPADDVVGQGVLYEVKRTLDIPGLDAVRTARVYRVEGATPDQARFLGEALFAETVGGQRFTVDEPLFADAPHRVEVAYRPGVMNPETAAILRAAKALGVTLAAADSSTVYAFYGSVGAGDVQVIVDRLLRNQTVERVVTTSPETLLITGESGPIAIVPLREASDEELRALSQDKLFLNPEEMRVIQEHFKVLGRDPTDAELETIAARWSEHCVHKTFKARIMTPKGEKFPFYTRIKTAAREYFGDLVLSAFADNSGVIRFYEGQAVCGKVETHNGPSALDPFGGAATGTGGVIRDILGTGQGGARTVISTDMFCFAPSDLSADELPPGTLHPDYLFRRVVAGVRTYGNQMGIPTPNGSVHFYRDRSENPTDFRAKPTVLVGAYGILPIERAAKGEPQVGDLVVVVGGRTGKDGIHGATFSSGEMTDRTARVNAGAVQIGNPIEEKRMADAIIEARNAGLIRAINDCGAAGFSSAIGEMGEGIGVAVDIGRAPLKYPGLAPWEIWLSESQERMALAISADDIQAFLDICQRYNVEATVLGEFDGSHRLTVKYGDQVAVDLDYKFLKDGLPQRIMEARYEQPPEADEETPEIPTDWTGLLKRVLAHGNVCSKEPIVRQYDHGVQGTNALPPFGGVHFDGPNDAVVLAPILGQPYRLVQSHGMNPVLNLLDPYEGSVWAAAEAMANYVAVGGNPDEAVLINNYVWPGTDPTALGSLDRSVDAVVDFMHATRRPVVSGKDSMSSRFRGGGKVIDIPPVLCISVFGRIPDVRKTVTSDIKRPGRSVLYLVGASDSGMGGSTYYDVEGARGSHVPHVDLDVLPGVLRGIHEAIVGGEVLSCHDVSEGGVVTTVAEMTFGGDCGATLNLDPKMERPDLFLLNETAGTFVIEVADDAAAERLFGQLPRLRLGSTTPEKELRVKRGDEPLFTATTDELKAAWQAPMKEIFP